MKTTKTPHAREPNSHWQTLLKACHTKDHPWGSVIRVKLRDAWVEFERLRVNTHNMDHRLAQITEWVHRMDAYRCRAYILGVAIPRPKRLPHFLRAYVWLNEPVPDLSTLRAAEVRLRHEQRQAEQHGERWRVDQRPLADIEREQARHAEAMRAMGLERKPGESREEFASRCRRAAFQHVGARTHANA